MRTRVVVQSRLSSSRLPGKAMLTVAGMPLIELVARRVANTGHEVVVATSEEHFDDHIAEHLASVGIPVFRGPLDDVLGRFVAATADLDDTDTVVRMTGDNPVADGLLVDELAAATTASGHTYGRVDIDQVPEGIGCEVFTAAAIREAHATTTDPYDREHVTPWLRRTFGELLWAPDGIPTDVHAYRATVDSLADYDRVARLFREHSDDPVGVSFRQLMGDVASAVDGAGSRAPLGADGLPEAVDLGSAPDRSNADWRELLRRSADRGADVVRVAVDDDASLALCNDSTLRGRLRVVLDLTPLPTDASADATRAAVERAFAILGGRKAFALVVPESADAGVRGAAGGYLAGGVVARLLVG
jgi:spore coat polysaccharide biosynthesis protein SpsF